MLAPMLAAAALFAPAPQTAAPQTAGYLLSADFERVSDLPYGPDLIRMFEPAGYFRGFAAANVDLAATFDHVVVGSEDLRSVTATFVIGNSSLSRDQLQKTLEAVFTATGQTIAWADHHGSLAGTPTKVDGTPGADPRWYVLLADGSLLIVPESEHEAFLDAPSDPPSDFEKKLLSLRKKRSRDSVWRLEVRHLRTVLKTSSVPMPDHVDIRILAKRKSELRADFEFATTSDARGFIDIWKTTVRDAIDANISVKIMLGGLYEATSTTRKKKAVQLRTPITSEQLELIAKATAGAVERELARAEARRERREAQEAAESDSAAISN